MGRELRMVPPNWDHPINEHGSRQPMFDRSYEDARQEWLDGLANHKTEDCDGFDYWEWDVSPPERKYYRPWRDEDATWFQLWETVSEGTPVSPPFETREELAAYLAEHGDFWDQERGHGGWGKARADAFVSVGWAPSFMMTGGAFLESKDIPLSMRESAENQDQ
jgi:hypothetical protein